MAVPNIRLIFCDSWGKLLKTEQFGDALTDLMWENAKCSKEVPLREM